MGKSRQPQLYGGAISRDEDGDFRGAEGHLGLNHTIDGTNLQAMNVGGEFGWGGDRGLYGARANATLAGAQHDPAAAGRSGFWGGVRTFDAGGGAYYDANSGVGEIGYRADLISGELGYREVDATSRTDRGARIGGSIGVPSGGIRGYNQDADGDGRREYGLGVSIPIPGTPFGVSADYTTETPVGDIVSSLIPGGMMINQGMDALGLEEYSPANLIQSGAESLWGWGSSLFD